MVWEEWRDKLSEINITQTWDEDANAYRRDYSWADNTKHYAAASAPLLHELAGKHFEVGDNLQFGDIVLAVKCYCATQEIYILYHSENYLHVRVFE